MNFIVPGTTSQAAAMKSGHLSMRWWSSVAPVLSSTVKRFTLKGQLDTRNQGPEILGIRFGLKHCGDNPTARSPARKSWRDPQAKAMEAL